jgi:hypothetical protein
MTLRASSLVVAVLLLVVPSLPTHAPEFEPRSYVNTPVGNVSPPLGQYDETKLLNIGTNRWPIRPEIGAVGAAWQVRWGGGL